MANVSFVKGTYEKYTQGKSTYDSNGSVYFCTDKPLIFANGVGYGVSQEIIESVLDGVKDVSYANKKITITYFKSGTPAKEIDLTQALVVYEGADAITVTGEGDTKTIALKIAEANKLLSQTSDGLTSTMKFIDNTEAHKIQLVGIGDAVLAEFDYQKFVIDGMLEKAAVVGTVLTLTLNTAAGKEPVTVDLADFVDTYTAGDGINIDTEDENKVSVKVKQNDKYITVSADGVASKGIDDAIAAAVNAGLVWNEA